MSARGLAKPSAPEEIWAFFIASKERNVPKLITRGPKGRLNRYSVRDIVRVVGEPPMGLSQGWRMLRIESSAPIQVAEGPKSAKGQMVTYAGVTQHLHYTNENQREELDTHSRGEFEPSNDTTAVLIPIGKSAQWWRLAQDVKQTYFKKTETYEGHTAIGLKYVDRVYRKLYHSKYTGPSLPYDFLTYFEFQSIHEDDFKLLLAELRDTERNPEWAFVGLEYEIWMTKLGPDGHMLDPVSRTPKGGEGDRDRKESRDDHRRDDDQGIAQQNRVRVRRSGV